MARGREEEEEEVNCLRRLLALVPEDVDVAVMLAERRLKTQRTRRDKWRAAPGEKNGRASSSRKAKRKRFSQRIVEDNDYEKPLQGTNDDDNDETETKKRRFAHRIERYN